MKRHLGIPDVFNVIQEIEAPFETGPPRFGPRPLLAAATFAGPWEHAPGLARDGSAWNLGQHDRWLHEHRNKDTFLKQLRYLRIASFDC